MALSRVLREHDSKRRSRPSDIDICGTGLPLTGHREHINAKALLGSMTVFCYRAHAIPRDNAIGALPGNIDM